MSQASEETINDDELIDFNGIDAETGEPFFPPMSVAELAKMALGDVVEEARLEELERNAELREQAHFGPTAYTDPLSLAETGWGVLFAYDEDPRVIDALRPLLDHRRGQTGGKLYYEYARDKGWRPGEGKFDFLKRHGVYLHGQVDPEKAPYYLLIVGSPAKIPYGFQFDIDTEFAVGRIHFDTPEEYGQYARSVVEAESSGPARARTAVFFGVKNQNDNATPMSVEHLITPLADFADDRARRKGAPVWEVHKILAEEATKPRLQKLLGGAETPAFLFTASHGMAFANAHPRQSADQGALLCSEWSRGTPPTPEHYFAAADLADDADIRGLIAVLFACFGAGTPKTNMFSVAPGGVLAPTDLVASLPRRLLARGALAVVGHVDTAIEKSFTWGGSGTTQLAEYKSLVAQLMSGAPVGHAMDGFGARYGVLEVQLGRYRQDIEYGGRPRNSDVTAVWAAKVDARAFVVVGDPAVRLNIPSQASAR